MGHGHCGALQPRAQEALGVKSLMKNTTVVWANSERLSIASIRATRALTRSPHVIFFCNYPQLKKWANSQLNSC